MKRILLAAPRGYCAGVDRAVQMVERALETLGAPVYVRKEIVHNRHVVSELEKRGAVFVESEEEIPEGSVCIFSAHGVSPEVRRNAVARKLQVIDATCPLVTKVHLEAKRFDRAGRQIVLVGHVGHEEIEGTAGEAPERTHVIEGVEQIEKLGVDTDEPIAYLTQTTLSMDDTNSVVEALRGRFTNIVGPHSDDICYATQNRQVAVKAIAPESDVVLIVGAVNSSNSNRMVEVAKKAGTPAYLVPDVIAAGPRLARRRRNHRRELGGQRARGPGGRPAGPAASSRVRHRRNQRGDFGGRDVLAASMAAGRSGRGPRPYLGISN